MGATELQTFLISSLVGLAAGYALHCSGESVYEFYKQHKNEIASNMAKNASNNAGSLVEEMVDEADDLAVKSQYKNTDTLTKTSGVLDDAADDLAVKTQNVNLDKTSYGKSSGVLSKPKGWKVGDPIDNLTRTGKEPSWSTLRARYWKNKAYYYADDYLESDLIRMRKGRAPIDIETGASMELHHINGRHITNPHNIDNLQEVWPWEHDAIDPNRHYTGPRPKGE